MSDIFLSYAREDAKSARRLAGALEARGWSVWWDHTIPPGSTWAEVIAREIVASRCVVVLWSSASIGSKWVNKEARKAESLGRLLPAVLEDGLQPPFEFEHIQAANLSDWKGGDESHAQLDLLLDQIALALGSEAAAPADRIAPTPHPPWRWLFGAGVGIAIVAGSLWVLNPSGDTSNPARGSADTIAGIPSAGDSLGIASDSASAPPRNTVVTPTRIGAAQLCQTAGQLQQVLPQSWVFEAYEGDGPLVDTEGVTVRNAAGEVEFYALAASGAGPVLDLFVTEQADYRTPEGVGPGTAIQQATLHYGPATLAYSTMNESREFATFRYGPENIGFRTGPRTSGFAGLYDEPMGEYNETARFRPDATIWQLWISCRRCPCPANG